MKLRIPDPAGLQLQQADDDRQAVLDPVMHLVEQ
jgi:hypothetical protein